MSFSSRSLRLCLRSGLGLAVVLCMLSACFLPAEQPVIVKIGLVAPFEGTFRYIGYDAIYAARLAVREINAAGGVGGRMLELVAYDDRADVEMAMASARSLDVDPDVVAVIGHYRQTTTAAAGEIYASAGIPLLVINAWLSSSEGGVWQLSPTPERVAEVFWTLHADGGPEAAGLCLAAGDAVGPAAALIARGAVREEGCAASTADRFVTAFTFLDPLESAAALVAWRGLSWTGRMVGGADLMAAAFSQVAGAASEGTEVLTPYPRPADLPGIAAWQAAYLAVGPHVPEPGPFSLPTYEAVYVIADAIRQAAETASGVSRAGVAASLVSAQHTGSLGKIAWDTQGFWEACPLYLYRWEQGTLKFVQRVDAAPVD